MHPRRRDGRHEDAAAVRRVQGQRTTVKAVTNQVARFYIDAFAEQTRDRATEDQPDGGADIQA